MRNLNACVSNDLRAKVIANENVRDVEIYQASNSFKRVLNQFLDGYHAVLAMDVKYYAIKARNLLAGFYRHFLDEIHDWLRDFVEALEDPRAALLKRGLATNDNVELNFTLTLTPATSQTKGLLHWTKCYASFRQNMKTYPTPETSTYQDMEPYRAPAKQGLGFWDVVLGVALGSWIGHSLFGDD
ncbi:hypothetical protein FACS189497_15330 [Betaproteobacteria bacterium]|nr:hypothetical protein FACS189497_15330 [Betaproteobacteria bacterium]